MRRLAILFATILLAACSTAADREIDRLRAELKSGQDAYNSCIARHRASPSYNDLRALISAENQNSPSMVTPADVKTFNTFYQLAVPCRRIKLESLGRVSAAHLAAAADYFAAFDAAVAEFLQKKTTVGQMNQALVQAYRRSDERDTRATAELNQTLHMAHERELAERKQAMDALANYLYQQQVLMQSQRAWNASNRMLFTSCNYNGVLINCTTY